MDEISHSDYGEMSHVDTWEKIPFLIIGENSHSLQMGEYAIYEM
jgi:hypothetical protein